MLFTKTIQTHQAKQFITGCVGVNNKGKRTTDDS